MGEEMKMMTKTKEIIILLIAAVIVGAIWWWGKSNIPSVPAPAPEEEATITNEAFDTTNWLTYRNEKYGFELKYPPDWQIVDSRTQPGFSSIGAFGFIPPTLKNQYCDVEREVQFLIDNWKAYNPRASNEEELKRYIKEAERYERVLSCSIQIHVEENSGQTIKDFLKINYLPYAFNRRQPGQTMADAIDRLKLKIEDGIEFVRLDSGFVKFYGGFEGAELEADLGDGMRQFIVNTGRYIIFINDRIHPTVKNKFTPDDLFDQVVHTVKILQKEG